MHQREDISIEGMNIHSLYFDTILWLVQNFRRVQKNEQPVWIPVLLRWNKKEIVIDAEPFASILPCRSINLYRIDQMKLPGILMYLNSSTNAYNANTNKYVKLITDQFLIVLFSANTYLGFKNIPLVFDDYHVVCSAQSIKGGK
jgi:hypothetical protein